MTILQKFIAQAGYCSRRKAEELIRDGRVRVNGKLAELGMSVDEGDMVEIDGERIEAIQEKIYIKLNKPIGYTCTNRKFKGEKNIFELLPEEYRHLHVVGRLDKNSRGLVLLTNDGDLTQRFTHPTFEHEKEYVVAINPTSLKLRGTRNEERKIKNETIEKIIFGFEKGVDITMAESEGKEIARAKLIEYLGGVKFRIILIEGKKRQIRRMFAAFDLEVADLLRIRIGGIALDDLKEGEWELLNKAKFDRI